jgi:hypothetical protein
MKTFSKLHFEEAQRLWKEGEFSDEWHDYRHAAAMRGFIYPPDGSKWDNWGDDEPSQRAVLIQMIRERPKALMAAINRSSSWHEVIAQCVADTERIAEDVAWAERRERHDRMQDEPTGPEAAFLLRDILKKAAS